MKTSTLRLSALPVLVRLSATGADSPGLGSTKIAIRIRRVRMSSLRMFSNASFTARARLSPRSLLYFSLSFGGRGPVLSV